jgi:DNA-binding winged helix-turn-helix (wHTH) protein
MRSQVPAGGRQSSSSVRFDVFELDFRSRELRKHGKRIRLQEQPFQILVMLLEAHGGVVLRDEIRDQLWPRDTVVEFEHSINAAVQRLRAALSDSAVRPRFIETVARRGYRFICPVEIPSAESLVSTKQPRKGIRQPRAQSLYFPWWT